MKTIDEDRAYFNGRYFVGLGLSFQKYKTTWQAVDMIKSKGSSIRAWSKEGQLIELDVSFYVQLEKDHVIDFFHRYGMKEERYFAIFKRIATRAIKQVTVNYEAADFFEKRGTIREDMFAVMRERFRTDFMHVELLALRNIDLPDAFENKIVEKVVTAQEIKTEEHIKNTNVKLAEIEVILGTADAEIKFMLAKADADAVRLVEKAKSDGNAELRAAEGYLYAQLKDTLGFNAQELVKYRYAQLTRQLGTTSAVNRTLNVLIGFDSPVISAS
jgi:regulator of protease activity HflC (stomatin/prohibitin superfamily)